MVPWTLAPHRPDETPGALLLLSPQGPRPGAASPARSLPPSAPARAGRDPPEFLYGGLQPAPAASPGTRGPTRCQVFSLLTRGFFSSVFLRTSVWCFTNASRSRFHKREQLPAGSRSRLLALVTHLRPDLLIHTLGPRAPEPPLGYFKADCLAVKFPRGEPLSNAESCKLRSQSHFHA